MASLPCQVLSIWYIKVIMYRTVIMSGSHGWGALTSLGSLEDSVSWMQWSICFEDKHLASARSLVGPWHPWFF